MEKFSQDPEDKILWALTSLGGKADRSYLRRRLDMKLAELEPALVALESKKKIKRTDFEKKAKPIRRSYWFSFGCRFDWMPRI